MNRHFDELGRIVIPKEMRCALNLAAHEDVRIELKGDKIILTNPNKFNIEEYIQQLMDRYDNTGVVWPVLNDILTKIRENK